MAGGATLSLGDLLLRERIITSAQLNSAVDEQRATSRSIGRVLVDKGFITEAMRMSILQKNFGFDVINLKNLKIDPLIATLVPGAFAEKHHVLPVRQEGGAVLVVAMEDPSDLAIIDAIKTQVGMRVKAYIAPGDELKEAIRSHYMDQGGGDGGAVMPIRAAAAERGPIFRAIRYSAFPILCFAPLVVLLLLVKYHTPFQQSLSQMKPFDIGLYTLLGWGLWAILLYEANGIIFGEKKKAEEEEA